MLLVLTGVVFYIHHIQFLLFFARYYLLQAVIRQRPRPTWLRDPTFEFYRLEELQWIDNAVDKHSVDALISFLKKCPSLQKLYINVSFFQTLQPLQHLTLVLIISLTITTS